MSNKFILNNKKNNSCSEKRNLSIQNSIKIERIVNFQTNFYVFWQRYENILIFYYLIDKQLV